MSRALLYGAGAVAGGYAGQKIGKGIGQKVSSFNVFPPLVKQFGHYRAAEIYSLWKAQSAPIDHVIVQYAKQDFYKRSFDIGGEVFADYVESKVAKFESKGIDVNLKEIIKEYADESGADFDQLVTVLDTPYGGPKVFPFPGLTRRLSAFLIDLFIVTVASLITGLFSSHRYDPLEILAQDFGAIIFLNMTSSYSLFDLLIVFILPIVYSLLCFKIWGKSLGQKLLGLSLIDKKTGKQGGWEHYGLDGVYLGSYIAVSVLMMPYALFSAISPERQIQYADWFSSQLIIDNKYAQYLDDQRANKH